MVIMVTDQDESEGHDEDEEHQAADAESPPGTVALHPKVETSTPFTWKLSSVFYPDSLPSN